MIMDRAARADAGYSIVAIVRHDEAFVGVLRSARGKDGQSLVNVAEVPMVDPTSIADERVGQPINPLTLIDVENEQAVIRAKSRTVVLSGSGDGVVDAAAGGLLDGSEAILYSASLTDADLDRAIADADAVIVTDSNRDRAHHWRGSQDVHGHTEPGGPGDDVLVATDADQRLGVFEDDAERQTIAVQSGPAGAIASAYGEPFAYRPEDRAVHAVDGDPSTAGSVAAHGDPVGERLRLTLSDTAAERDGGETVTLRQIAPAPGGRAITSVRLTIDDARVLDIELDETSFEGQTISDPSFADMTTLDIEITDVSDGDAALAASRAGVGFAEVDLGRGPTTEVIRVPVDAVTEGPLAIVLTRLRVDPSDPWRGDPEPALVRSIRTTTPRRFDTLNHLHLA